MQLSSLNSEQIRSSIEEKNSLSAFRLVSEKPNKITQDMTPTEIAEIVSDHFIEEVKNQFKVTEQQLKK